MTDRHWSKRKAVFDLLLGVVGGDGKETGGDRLKVVLSGALRK